MWVLETYDGRTWVAHSKPSRDFILLYEWSRQLAEQGYKARVRRIEA